MRAFTFFIDHQDTIKEWMIKETASRTSTRYKQVHIAEDMGVNTSQLWRFMNNKKVSEDFYIKWFNWYMKN
jgi:hypothetical protein